MAGRLGAILAPLWLLALGAATAPPVAAAAIPADWITVSADSILTLKAPPGTRFRKERDTDGFVGTFVGPGFVLQLAYGAHSNPLADPRPYVAYVAQPAQIDGKPATIVSATVADPAADRRYFIGLHVPELGRSGRGALSLTISGTAATPGEEGLMLRIFETIRLKSQR